MPKAQRTFTKACKLEAVRLANTSGKPITEIARNLGISESAIHNWRKQFAQQGELYLAAVLDVYSRCVVGWSMDRQRDEQLVSNVLHMALTGRWPQAGLLHHSDRGSQ